MSSRLLISHLKPSNLGFLVLTFPPRLLAVIIHLLFLRFVVLFLLILKSMSRLLSRISYIYIYVCKEDMRPSSSIFSCDFLLFLHFVVVVLWIGLGLASYSGLVSCSELVSCSALLWLRALDWTKCLRKSCHHPLTPKM